MKPAPKPLDRGPAWLREWLNRHLDFSVSIRPLPSEDCEIDEVPDGCLIKPIIPSSDQGSSASIVFQPLELALATSGGETPEPRIRVYASTIAGGSSTDIGFTEGDDPPYLLTPSEGVLQGGITIDGTTGEVTSRWLEIVSELGTDDDTTFYVEIGTVAAGETEGSWIVSNSRYGPIHAQICRNWYASSAPYFGVNWS